MFARRSACFERVVEVWMEAASAASGQSRRVCGAVDELLLLQLLPGAGVRMWTSLLYARAARRATARCPHVFLRRARR